MHTLTVEIKSLDKNFIRLDILIDGTLVQIFKFPTEKRDVNVEEAVLSIRQLLSLQCEGI